jgi:leucyl-tRNA synthetase
LLLGAEGMDDPDWRSQNAADVQSKLESLYAFVSDIINEAKNDDDEHMEKWLVSRLQHRVEDVTQNLEELKTRTALEIALFEVWNDFRWYVRRKGSIEAKILHYALEVWLKLLVPFAPFICEELWSLGGKKSFISLAEWPEAEKAKVDLLAEEQESLLVDLIEDTLNVLKATKITPSKVCYYTATGWKWKVFREVLKKAVAGEVKIKEIMDELVKDNTLKGNMKAVASFVPKALKALNKMPIERKNKLIKVEIAGEKDFIKEASSFLEERFNAKVAVYSEDEKSRYDPKQRAMLAIPFQPAIFIE